MFKTNKTFSAILLLSVTLAHADIDSNQSVVLDEITVYGIKALYGCKL